MTEEFVYKSVPLDQLIPYPYQSRLDVNNGIEQLIQSIEKHGVLNPSVVLQQPDEKFMIISGHRRAQACRILGYTEMPAKIYYKLDKDQAAQIHLEENDTSKQLSALEKAYQYQKMLQDGGWSLEELSQLTGIPKTTLFEYISILKFPKPYKQLIEKEIGFSNAIQLAKLLPAEHTGSLESVKHRDYSTEFEMLINKVKKNGQPRVETQQVVDLIRSDDWIGLPRELKSILLNNPNFYFDFSKFVRQPKKYLQQDLFESPPEISREDSEKIARYIAGLKIPYRMRNKPEINEKICKYITNMVRRKIQQAENKVDTSGDIYTIHQKFTDLFNIISGHPINFKTIPDSTPNMINVLHRDISTLMGELERLKNTLNKMRGKEGSNGSTNHSG